MVSGVVVGFSTVIVTGPVFTVSVDETVLEVIGFVEVDVLTTDVLEVLEVLAVVLVVLRVVVIETVVPVAPPGGSRWSMKLRVVGTPVTPVPTANPLVLDRSERLFSSPIFGMAGERVVTVQVKPS